MRQRLEDLLASSEGVELLASLVDTIRPRARTDDAGVQLRRLVASLDADSELAAEVRRRARHVLQSLRLVHVLVSGGVVSNKGLFAEVKERIGSVLLPPAYPDDDVRSIIAAVFTRRNDWQWVCGIAAADWAALLVHLVEPTDPEGIPHPDIEAAIRALAQRVGAAGIDEEVSSKLPHTEHADSPFLSLSVTAHEFLVDHKHGVGSVDVLEDALAHAQRCRDVVKQLRDNQQIYGTSMRLTRITRALLQQLRRFELLLRLVHPRDDWDFARSLAPLLQELVAAQQAGHRVGRLVGQSVDLVAYQITEHAARKGEAYVAHTRRAYGRFLLAAMGGGALVGVFAVVKLFLSKLSLSLAAQAFVYGLNYAVCFVLIYTTGGILATKQPAVTASAIAHRLDRCATRDEATETVADTVVLIWRSQFVSFLGNIICAFPVAIVIAYVLEHAFGVETASPAKVRELLDANHPWHSGALFYAAIAGVCLFLGGVIQGAVQNRAVHTNLRARLDRHPRLMVLGRLRPRFVAFVTRHLSGIVSNAALGFMLGSAGVVGIIFGLPIDIRHIAFSSAHAGVAVLDAPALVDGKTIATVLLGILGIGLVNFLVSFGLTLTVSLTSRQVTFGQTSRLVLALLRRLVTRPLHWHLPLGNYEHVVTDEDAGDQDEDKPRKTDRATPA